jgi:hypothetical protein
VAFDAEMGSRKLPAPIAVTKQSTSTNATFRLGEVFLPKGIPPRARRLDLPASTMHRRIGDDTGFLTNRYRLFSYFQASMRIAPNAVRYNGIGSRVSLRPANHRERYLLRRRVIAMAGPPIFDM